MTQSTALDLDAIQARADAAIEGPWEGIDDDFMDETSIRIEGEDPSFYTEIARCCQGPATVAFIVEARADVPALVAEVRRLRALLAGQA